VQIAKNSLHAMPLFTILAQLTEQGLRCADRRLDGHQRPRESTASGRSNSAPRSRLTDSSTLSHPGCKRSAYGISTVSLRRSIAECPISRKLHRRIEVEQ
jgi:hypothetical protein